jgi:hypothetical protein
MAFTIPEIEPLNIAAGDRVQWTRTFSDFPATAWTLTYYLRANLPGGQIDITASASGSSYSVDIPTTSTEGYMPGLYYWSAFVSASGDRKLVAQGRIEILENPAGIVIPVDKRSHARRTLEAIKAVIERRATTDQQAYVFQAVGRSVTKMPIKDLLDFLSYYQAIVTGEERAEKSARGENSGKNVLVRFNI